MGKSSGRIERPKNGVHQLAGAKLALKPQKQASALQNHFFNIPYGGSLRRDEPSTTQCFLTLKSLLKQIITKNRL